MLNHQSRTLPERKKAPHKLIAGFAALAVTAVITASGFAAATTPSQPPQGSGYGNNVSVTNNVGISLKNSNGNIITVVTNVFINIFN